MPFEIFLLFLSLLFVVAFMYSSIGHGGASGYLALMALFSVAPEVMKPTALMLNLFVSLISFIHYYRKKHFKFSVFLPIAIASIPMAFVGGMIPIQTHIYKIILGIFLLIPILRLLLTVKHDIIVKEKMNKSVALLAGGSIGFFSGLIGIGGGIILSPLLLLLRWSDMRQTAAISALFIFVNSASGLLGQSIKGVSFTSDMYVFVVVAFVGGYLGAYLGASKFNLRILKILLALVLFIASYKLLFTSA